MAVFGSSGTYASTSSPCVDCTWTCSTSIASTHCPHQDGFYNTGGTRYETASGSFNYVEPEEEKKKINPEEPWRILSRKELEFKPAKPLSRALGNNPVAFMSHITRIQ